MRARLGSQMLIVGHGNLPFAQASSVEPGMGEVAMDTTSQICRQEACGKILELQEIQAMLHLFLKNFDGRLHSVDPACSLRHHAHH